MILCTIDLVVEYGNNRTKAMYCMVAEDALLHTVEPPSKGHFGTNHSVHIVERMSSSWRLQNVGTSYFGTL